MLAPSEKTLTERKTYGKLGGSGFIIQERNAAERDRCSSSQQGEMDPGLPQRTWETKKDLWEGGGKGQKGGGEKVLVGVDVIVVSKMSRTKKKNPKPTKESSENSKKTVMGGERNRGGGSTSWCRCGKE